MSFRYFSTFTGIGGFEIGIQNAWLRSQDKGQAVQGSQARDSQGRTEQLYQHGAKGLSCVGYSEIDKYAIKVYEKHNPGVKNYGDITKINAKELPDFDCLVGGFPCQAFSIAGKRMGFGDTRGTLFFDLARILQAKQPRLFVFENVKGLLSHDNGQTFATIIATITELGYDCQWQVLNSKNFGVPQNRERVYIVGHLRGTPRPEVFPITSNDGEDTQPDKGRSTELFPTIRATHYKNGDNQPVIADFNRKDGIGKELEVAHTLSAGEPTGTLSRLPHENAPNRSSKERLQETLKGQLGSVRIRRLTPLETERLQGFPDNWTAQGTDGAISDTQRYKMCGNAVTTNVVQAVFERIFNESN